MATTVGKETLYLQNQLDEINELQRTKDISEQRETKLSARQRDALNKGDSTIIEISQSETNRHEEQIKLLKPKFATLG